MAEGVYVVAGARKRSDELDALVDEGHASFVDVDLAVPDGPAALVAAAMARHQRIDILVNNVGAAATRTDGFLSVTDDQWLSSITLNLMAAVRTTRAALVPMLDAGKGSIVTTSSVNAFLPDPAVIDYGAAKAALSNFCKAISKEFGPRGIRVNTISPGPRRHGLVARRRRRCRDCRAGHRLGPGGRRGRRGGRQRHRQVHAAGRDRSPGGVPCE